MFVYVCKIEHKKISVVKFLPWFSMAKYKHSKTGHTGDNINSAVVSFLDRLSSSLVGSWSHTVASL